MSKIMNDFNFFESCHKRKKLKLDKKIIYCYIILALILSLFLYCLFNYIKIKDLNKKNLCVSTNIKKNNLNNEILKIRQKQKMIEKLEKDVKRLNLLNEYIIKKDLVNDLLIKTIIKNVPQEIFIESLNINIDTIEIKGLSIDKVCIGKLEDSLSIIDEFQNVFISHISTKDENFYDFTLNIDIKDDEIENEMERVTN